MESIAKEVGVSAATVSRVLNGKPGISDEVRERVSEALRQRSYQRRVAPAKKGKPRLHTVAFVVSDDLFERINEGDDYYGRHLIAVQKAITDAGFYPLVISYSQNLDRHGMLRCISEKRAQAIIGESWSTDLTERAAREVPVVLFNRISSSPNVDTVSTDMHGAAQAELQHLYDLGHRAIAYFRTTEPLAGWEDICFWQQYHSFCKVHQLEIPPAFLEPISFGTDEHDEAALDFVKRVVPHGATAIATSDVYVPSLLKALEQLGVSVPEEMSIIGFNDIKDCLGLAIPLTTYRQDFEFLAQEAMRLIMDRFNHPDAPPRLVRIPGTLVVRQSTMPPAEKGSLALL